MRKIGFKLIGILATCLLLMALVPDVAPAAGSPGQIVVNHDEWTLSNSGFSQAPVAAAQFALNVASWFTGGGNGQFLVYSNNFGLTQSSFLNTLTGAGHTVTVSTVVPFTVANLLNYDGVFLGGVAANNSVLIDYVQAGGNVYLAGGTGSLGNENWVWNTFLNAYGLALGPSYNGIGGTLGGVVSHPVTAGVSSLYYDNGNTVIKQNPADPSVHIVALFNGQGLIGVYESACDTDLTWNAPLSDTATYEMSNGVTLPVRFRWGSCQQFEHDESVIVMISNQTSPDDPITGHVYGWDIWIDDVAEEYGFDFDSSLYGLPTGTVLQVEIYIGDALVGVALVKLV